jgi:ferrous iron transport protein B
MPQTNKTITIALAGNPNSGKTTIFNALTRERAQTGNWPGVTVAKREGELSHKGYKIHVVDLPGTYSLTSGTPEEIVARNFIIEGHPDVVVDIVDSSNLERNLVLASEIIELGPPLVVAINMWDEVEKKGYKVDVKLVSQLLASPCVPTVAPRREGIGELLDEIIAIVEGRTERRKITVGYGRVIEQFVERVQAEVESIPELAGKYPPRWLAVKLLENDSEIVRMIGQLGERGAALKECVEKSSAAIERKLGEYPEIAIPDHRFGFAAGIFREAVRLPAQERRSFSEQVDRVVMSRAFGLPIFIILMWLTFQLTFAGGAPLMDLIDAAVGSFGRWMMTALPEGVLNSLTVDGIIAGVGGVIIFLPNILILFLIITFLEEYGYMARAAFVMDGLMHKIGLHGKSFVPLLMGFGCSVPAIMATRTLETRRDRLVTMGIAPLMSCGARLPIYTLLIGAFFHERIAGNMLFLIYVIGVLVAVLVALIFRKTIFRGETTPFVMELPPYRMPTLASVAGITWNRGAYYLKKAGTVILAASVVIWFLSNYPYNPDTDPQWAEKAGAIAADFDEEVKRLNAEYASLIIPADTEGVRELIDEAETAFSKTVADIDEQSIEYVAAKRNLDEMLHELEVKYPAEYDAGFAYHLAVVERREALKQLERDRARVALERSFAGGIGRNIEPVLRPCGFDWKIGIALFTGLAAKEIVVSTMGTIYALGGADETSGALKEAIRNDDTFSPLVAFSMMIFVLLYSPCLAAIAVERSESGSWRWALFVFAYLTVIAWICSMLVFQAGSALGIGG